MARTQAETIAALREKIQQLKGENADLIEENENLTDTLQSIYDAAAETLPVDEADEEENDPDLDD